MHVLITGHTGFKGAWLTLLLKRHGYTVSGLALDPLKDGLFLSVNVAADLEHDVRMDIRDADGVRTAFQAISPDVVVHMAAQPLVRESYREPRRTIETNVNGTLNVLLATAATPSVSSQLIVTTDKVYRNIGKMEGYVESDALGGDDPYSSSKAMADLLTQSWVKSFAGPPTAIARAGNVIGGGDVSPERLLPDLISAFVAGRAALIRFPGAVRPWQHVLDCLNGYLQIIKSLQCGEGVGAWNIGPSASDFLTVGDVATLAAAEWGRAARWEPDPAAGHPHEAAILTLDSTKARTELGWQENLNAQEAVARTVQWHLARNSGCDARTLALRDLDIFLSQQ